jgi:hypothetical protein
MNQKWATVIAFASIAAAGCGKGTAELSIETVGDTMAYDVSSLTVKSGQSVHLVLTNRGTSQVMKHNWVLVQPGHEADIATAAISAGETANYVPRGDANVLANTSLASAGGMAEVTFTAPAAGTYPYICTFPGHSASMKGTLVVTP